MSFLAKIVEVSFLVHLNAADMVAWPGWPQHKGFPKLTGLLENCSDKISLLQIRSRREISSCGLNKHCHHCHVSPVTRFLTFLLKLIAGYNSSIGYKLSCSKSSSALNPNYLRSDNRRANSALINRRLPRK